MDRHDPHCPSQTEIKIVKVDTQQVHDILILMYRAIKVSL